MVSPAEFIPVAEQTGLIEPLGDWVLEAAALQQIEWTERGLPHISVNVSPTQLRAARLGPVRERISAHGVDPPADRADRVLDARGPTLAEDRGRRLHGLGLKIAIDDFGTGYSSLSGCAAARRRAEDRPLVHARRARGQTEAPRW